MLRLAWYGRIAVCSFFAALVAAAPVHADKPAWAGGGNKHEGKGKGRGEHDGSRGDERRAGPDRHFQSRHALVVREYYDEHTRGGHCPPGLAKKRNGCLPPGQAKKWAIGQPLPRGVVFYELPPALVIELGRPPAGYKYVRVAADILMIAVGTSLVVDAITDLGRM